MPASQAPGRALQLLESGKVRTKSLITATFDVAAWQDAFEGFERKTAIKTLLHPSGS